MIKHFKTPRGYTRANPLVPGDECTEHYKTSSKPRTKKVKKKEIKEEEVKKDDKVDAKPQTTEVKKPDFLLVQLNDIDNLLDLRLQINEIISCRIKNINGVV